MVQKGWGKSIALLTKVSKFSKGCGISLSLLAQGYNSSSWPLRDQSVNEMRDPGSERAKWRPRYIPDWHPTDC